MKSSTKFALVSWSFAAALLLAFIVLGAFEFGMLGGFKFGVRLFALLFGGLFVLVLVGKALGWLAERLNAYLAARKP